MSEDPDWIEQLDDDADAELSHVARKILHSQSERDAYAALDHYARSVRKRVYRRAGQALHKRVSELEHQLAQAAETERHLRAYRAPLRKIAELEAQLASLTATSPDQMASVLQGKLTERAAEISELKRIRTALAKQLKVIERERSEAAECIRELRAQLARAEAQAGGSGPPSS